MTTPSCDHHLDLSRLLIPVLLACLCAGTGLGQTYTTAFSGTEDPLSEGGRWHNEGVDWTHIRKVNGLVCGTQTGTNTGIYRFNDSFAHLTGFPPDQEAWGEARITNPNATCAQELEILLRWNSSPHRATGYECFARCVSTPASYVQIVRWDGPLGKFTYLADLRGTNYGLKNGDILKASIVGSRITVFINGIEKARVVDRTFATGNPGIGEFLDCEGAHRTGGNGDFGFANFTARAVTAQTSQSPTPPTSSTERPTGPSLECYAISDLARVFEDGYGAGGPPRDALSLFGLRNETVSAQCVVLAHQDLLGLTVSVGDLRQTGGSGVIPQQNLEWNFVDGIFIEKNSPNRPPQNLLRPAPAWFPDYLGEERQVLLRKGQRKAIYLTVKIPVDAPPGQYQGAVRLSAGATSVSLPLAVQVYALTLPDQRHLFVTEWFSTAQFSKHHQVRPGDDEQFYRWLKIYADNMAAHRQNTFRIGLGSISSRRGPDGKLQFDFSRFDKEAQVFWDTGHMDLLETGFVAQFGKEGWASREIALAHFPVEEVNGRRSSVSGEEFLPQFLPALVAHLWNKGWLAKSVFHICDEPSDHNVLDWRRASEAVHRWAPELRRIDAIETPHCLGALEVWVPKLDHLASWQPAYEQAQRQGNELWFYTVGIYQGGGLLNKTVDVPLIETRLMHWLNYRYDLRGYLHWGFNEWTDDPIKAPGLHRGDGWQVYPGKTGLLNSLRWEQMRNGLEDYECLWLLEQAIAQIKTGLAPRVAAFIDPRRRGVEISTRVVADYYHHTDNPELLYEARRQAIEETLALEQSPRVLLQTIPLEHSFVAKGCAVDLHGWAEPGTVLMANGELVPVAGDGLFLASVSPSADGQITLEAQSTKGSKRLVRQFR